MTNGKCPECGKELVVMEARMLYTSTKDLEMLKNLSGDPDGNDYLTQHNKCENKKHGSYLIVWKFDYKKKIPTLVSMARVS